MDILINYLKHSISDFKKLESYINLEIQKHNLLFIFLSLNLF